MKLIIETYPRGDGFLALAVPEGARLTEGGVYADASERRAILGATHNYFNRQEKPATVVVHEPHPADEWYDEQRPQRGGRLVYTDQSSIKRALVAAVSARLNALDNDLDATNSREFLMNYVDQGGAHTTRTIIPGKVEDRQRGVAGFPETYLVAYDVKKDESRTFRVDRIERLEAL